MDNQHLIKILNEKISEAKEEYEYSREGAFLEIRDIVEEYDNNLFKLTKENVNDFSLMVMTTIDQDMLYPIDNVKLCHETKNAKVKVLEGKFLNHDLLLNYRYSLMNHRFLSVVVTLKEQIIIIDVTVMNNYYSLKYVDTEFDNIMITKEDVNRGIK